MRVALALSLLLAASGARPGVGESAPDFTLPGTAGKPVSLAELTGKHTVVLAFFPKAFTGG
jgi:thioredoxin-dependent peroxiredoxin